MQYRVNWGGAQWGLVLEMVRKKQALEVMLAWDLLETFNRAPELIGPLRAMAGKALEEMLWMPVAPVEEAIAAERSARMQLLVNRVVLPAPGAGGSSVVKTVSRQDDLAEVLADLATLDAQFCSDVVRLYGTAVEKAAGGTSSAKGYYAKLLGEMTDERRGGSDVWNKDPRAHPHGRHRFDRGKQPLQYQQAIEAAKPGAVQQFLNAQKGGQAQFALADTSTVARMDRVFGTVPAADISGTTSDTIFFIKRFSAENYLNCLDPIFYLLPLATIVAGAHHSLLEVALPLSQAGIVDYRIGFYETLLPARPGYPAHGGVESLRAALHAAEHHADNQHFLLCYQGVNAVGGCLLPEPAEMPRYRAFAQATRVLTAFRNMPPWPTREQIGQAAAAAGLRC